MASLGLFDPELRLEGLIDPAFLIEGWFDPEMVSADIVVVPPIPPTPEPSVKGARVALGSLRMLSPRVALQPVQQNTYIVQLLSVAARITSISYGGGKVSLGPLRIK